MISPPETDEYGAYYDIYISKVSGSDIAELLTSQVEGLKFVVEQMDDEMAAQPYAPGKWTYKQLLGHINDTEKIMFFRALCLARNEKQALPGFDQDAYVQSSGFNEVPLYDLLQDFEYIRNSLAYFLKHLSEEASKRTGTVSGQPTSVRSLLYIITGHFEHHYAILKEFTQNIK